MTRAEAMRRAMHTMERNHGQSRTEVIADALLQARREALEEAIKVTDDVAMLVDETSSQSGIIAAISTGIHALIKKDAEIPK